MASLRTTLFEGLIRAAGIKRRLRRLADAANDPARLQRLVEKQRRWDRPTPPKKIMREWAHETLEVDGFDLHVMTQEESRRERVILYLHGGGFMFGPFRSEWMMIGKMAAASGCDFALLDYPKAPEHQAAQTVVTVRNVVEALVARYGAPNTVLVGSSAGGALAVVVMAALRDDDLPQPSRAVLLSPSVDLTMADDVAGLERTDILVSAAYVRAAGRVYAHPLQPGDPLVSPTFASLEALAPLYLFAGTNEVLLPSIETFAGRTRESGTTVRLVVGLGQQHTWPTLPTPEGHKALRQIVDIIGARIEAGP